MGPAVLYLTAMASSSSIAPEDNSNGPGMQPAPSIYRIAITGGPCAGKTTALAEVSERLRSRGFGVYVVPEAATLMFTGGASFVGMDATQVLNFQTQLLKTQMALEDAFTNVAKASCKESFVLCDRGACDGKAYMEEALWRQMLHENGWDTIELRDGRYELVVHLVTAADGAREFYTLDNNQTRTESAEEAVKVDRRTQEAWVGHPHLRVVDNRTGFREKIDRVDARVSELARVPKLARVPLSRGVVRKFLVCGKQNVVGSIGGEEFIVEQTFLLRKGEGEAQESVRKRGKDGVFTYVHKVHKGGHETKRQITLREYESLLAHRDVKRETVMIRRRCFLCHGNYFVMDAVLNVHPRVTLLRCHCDAEEERLEIPEWLKVEREVTGENEYFMHTLSERATSLSSNEFERLTEDEGV